MRVHLPAYKHMGHERVVQVQARRVQCSSPEELIFCRRRSVEQVDVMAKCTDQEEGQLSFMLSGMRVSVESDGLAPSARPSPYTTVMRLARF